MQKIVTLFRKFFLICFADLAYIVGMLRTVFIKSEAQNASLLGKTALEHMLCGLEIDEAEFVEEDERIEGECAYLSADMPLVRRDDIERIAARMRAKGIKELRLGSADSPSRITLGGENSGIFVNDIAFLKIVDTKSLSMVYNHLKKRVIDMHLARGVNIPLAESVVIDATARIEAGANIMPFSRIEGNSFIGSGATVSSSLVKDSQIGAGSVVEMAHVISSKVGERASIGPFARLRGADIGDGARIGDFVEVKASCLGDGSKAAHLAYIGDAEVGARTNIGCGAVFCNFDGKAKHKSKVGEDCFIGANVNLVSPISVGDGAFVAAGTTLTEDVGAHTFSIGRARQNTKTL